MPRVEQLSALQNSRLRAACGELLLRFKTQNALADALGLTPGAFSQFLRAKTGASEGVARKIAKLAGVTAEELLWGDSEKDVLDLAADVAERTEEAQKSLTRFIEGDADLEELIVVALKARAASQKYDAEWEEPPDWTIGMRAYHPSRGTGTVVGVTTHYDPEGQRCDMLNIDFAGGRMDVVADSVKFVPQTPADRARSLQERVERVRFHRRSLEMEIRQLEVEAVDEPETEVQAKMRRDLNLAIEDIREEEVRATAELEEFERLLAVDAANKKPAAPREAAGPKKKSS